MFTFCDVMRETKHKNVNMHKLFNCAVRLSQNLGAPLHL